jgi:cyclophilin family peptidyl-prolyl cis-trans isomerase
MPRRKQTVQKQHRHKVYAGSAMSGEATHIKPKGAFRIFTNYRLFAVIGVVVLTGGLMFGAFYSGGRNGSSSATTVRGEGVIRTTPEANDTAVATGAQANIKQYSAPPPMTIDVAKTYTATLKTEKGDVKVVLDPKEAPQAVNNFVFLARDGFYNGVTFYRVIADGSGQIHFAQAGDPTGTGIGNPGYDLPTEKTSEPFTAGILAMAKPAEAGAANNGSQFFFTLQTEPTLDGKFTAFGKVADDQSLAVLNQLTPRDPLLGSDAAPGARIDSITIDES